MSKNNNVGFAMRLISACGEFWVQDAAPECLHADLWTLSLPALQSRLSSSLSSGGSGRSRWQRKTYETPPDSQRSVENSRSVRARAAPTLPNRPITLNPFGFARSRIEDAEYPMSVGESIEANSVAWSVQLG
jgi:hypothetical protein